MEQQVFFPFIEKEGRTYWVALSASAFRDRDGEIISRKALDYAVKFADRTGERGELRLFHLPGSRVGECLVSFREDCFLVEAGIWDETPLAQAAMKTIRENPDRYGVSIGFVFDPQYAHDGVFEDRVVVIERSITTKERAACPFTSIELASKEVSRMSVKDDLIELVGAENAERVLERAKELSEKLREYLAFKEASEGEAGKDEGERVEATPEGQKEEDEMGQEAQQKRGLPAELLEMVRQLDVDALRLLAREVARLLQGLGYGYPGYPYPYPYPYPAPGGKKSLAEEKQLLKEAVGEKVLKQLTQLSAEALQSLAEEVSGRLKEQGVEMMEPTLELSPEALEALAGLVAKHLNLAEKFDSLETAIKQLREELLSQLEARKKEVDDLKARLEEGIEAEVDRRLSELPKIRLAGPVYRQSQEGPSVGQEGQGYESPFKAWGPLYEGLKGGE